MSHPNGRAERRERNARALLAREEDRASTRDSRAVLAAERVTIGGRSVTIASLARAIERGDA
jgi:hypothetical protein